MANGLHEDGPDLLSISYLRARSDVIGKVSESRSFISDSTGGFGMPDRHTFLLPIVTDLKTSEFVYIGIYLYTLDVYNR